MGGGISEYLLPIKLLGLGRWISLSKVPTAHS